jgi:type I restriction enzyme S subunit
VDFDPVRAKAEGRDPVGVPPEVADLFPSEFEDSELGAIPKGWTVSPLDGVADFLNGLAMQKFPVTEGDDWLPVIKIAQLRKGDTEGSDRASLQVPADYVIRDGDVLFSWSGSLEVEIWCSGVGALNQHLFKVTSNRFPKWFFYLWTKHHLPSFREIAANKATTMGHIQRRHLTEAKVVIPPQATLDAISRTIAPLVERTISVALEARTLMSLRDTLLPRLMSGKLRIPSDEQVPA